MALRISREARLMAVILISGGFFLAEISVGFYTHSLALVADAFHYLNDLIGFIVALVALRVSKNDNPPAELSFGWERAQLLGAFFNGVLLLALGVSVFLQSIERFISLQYVDDPKLMFVIAAVGLGLNLLSVAFLHEHHGHHHGHSHGHSHGHGHGHSHSHTHDEEPEATRDRDRDSSLSLSDHQNHKHTLVTMEESGKHHDLGMMGVLLHVLGDAANNLGVMVAALVIWFARYDGRYYADPGTSMGIAVMIILSSFPLIRHSGMILLESAPEGVNPVDVKDDLETIPEILTVQDLRIWRLNQQTTLASVHITLTEDAVPSVGRLIRVVKECFHAYGVDSVTVQPEIVAVSPGVVPGEKGVVVREKCSL